jgi:spore coat protein U-like protein
MSLVPSRLAQRTVAAFLALAGLPMAPVAQTYTVASGMPVTIEIVMQCTVSATDLDFGAYSTDSVSPKLGQSSITLLCSAGTVADVALDSGTGPGRNTNRRQMSQEAGPNRLDYELHQDAGRTIHWGDNSGRDTLELPMTGVPQTVPVYGRIPAGQRARDGTYSDVITVQVQF